MSRADALPAPEFSRPLRTAALDRGGETLTARADDGERRALARRYAILEVRRLSVEARIIPDADGWRVEGRARARVVQTCVATLAPVVQDIDEPFARTYLPGAAPPDLSDLDPDEGEDPPEPLGPRLDPAEMAAEAIALALDPYPRAPEAAEPVEERAAPDGAAPIEETARPFAGLAALRDKLSRDDE